MKSVGLRDELIGTWTLVSYVETPVNGSPQHFPLGEKGRVCQVVEKSERVIIRDATYLRRPLHGPHLLPAVHLAKLHLAGS